MRTSGRSGLSRRGTVARGQLHDDTYFYTGKIGNTPGDYMPFQVTEKDLARGRERYNIYCAPCHSRMGDDGPWARDLVPSGPLMPSSTRKTLIKQNRHARRRERENADS